jgi:glyoxylase-like metal-dependent hydrolase (beta-lactamase superfamily II)
MALKRVGGLQLQPPASDALSFMRALTAAGFSVDDIDFVMCTHLHVDHVGWNARLQDGRLGADFP